MRTTLEIDPELLTKVVQATQAKSKKQAIEIALNAFLRSLRRKELSDLIGNYNDFALTLDELNRMRRES